MKAIDTRKSIRDICWKNFEATGRIGSYLLYSRVAEERDGADTGNNNKKCNL